MGGVNMRFIKGLMVTLAVLLIIAFVISVAIYLTAQINNDTFVNVAQNWWTVIKDWFVSIFSKAPVVE